MKVGPLEFSQQLKLMKGVDGIANPLGGEQKKIGETPGEQKQSFGEFLIRQIEAANRDGVEAERAIQRSIAGEETNPHETIIAVQKASVSLTLMMGIKERLERAYQELIRTPI